MASKIVRNCSFCHGAKLLPPGLRWTTRRPLKTSIVTSMTSRRNFGVSASLEAKSMEEIREDDIRADVDGIQRKRVTDYSNAQLNDLCDISRLPRQLGAKLSHREQLLPPIDKKGATVEKQRMLYANLGQKCGFPLGIMWPSKSQLQHTVEDEKTYFATLQEMIKVVKDKEAQEIEENRKKQAEITLKMKDMPDLIKEFKQKQKVRHEAEEEAMSKKTEMLDEAREFFGYAIQENDDRIVKFMEQKEAAEKEKIKAEKKAIKQAEAKKQLEELAKKATEEALRMAEQDAQQKADLRMADQDAQQKADLRMVEQDAQQEVDLRMAEQDAQQKADLGMAEQDEQQKADLKMAEQDAQQKADLKMAQQDAQQKAYLRMAEQDAQQKADLKMAEQDAQQKADLRMAEQDAQQKADLKMAEQDAQQKADQNSLRKDADYESDQTSKDADGEKGK